MGFGATPSAPRCPPPPVLGAGIPTPPRPLATAPPPIPIACVPRRICTCQSGGRPDRLPRAVSIGRVIPVRRTHLHSYAACPARGIATRRPQIISRQAARIVLPPTEDVDAIPSLHRLAGSRPSRASALAAKAARPALRLFDDGIPDADLFFVPPRGRTRCQPRRMICMLSRCVRRRGGRLRTRVMRTGSRRVGLMIEVAVPVVDFRHSGRRPPLAVEVGPLGGATDKKPPDHHGRTTTEKRNTLISCIAGGPGLGHLVISPG